jgi:hypothetical protein
MGERPAGRSLGRIDGTKGYEPGNCRWSTPMEQQLNAKHTILYRLDGELVSQNRAAKLLGVSRWSLQNRDHPSLTRVAL